MEINIDELFKRKQEVDMNRISIYDKILKRAHKHIKVTARQQPNDPWCFFLVPEFIIGIPKYDISACISYIIQQLTENGFHTKYTHPNLIFISWKHYIPSYKRLEIKKRTGVKVDGFGNIIKEKKEIETNKVIAKKKDFKAITSYKPQGIYNNNLIKKINAKLN